MAGVRLIYIDDSGAAQTRTMVYGWVELHFQHWRTALRQWLNWRQELYRAIGLPTDYELHATKFVGGRGHPTGTDWDRNKSYRTEVMEEALRTIAALPGLRTGAVFQRGEPITAAFRADTYAKLVRWFDAELAAGDEYGMVLMDGDGTDPTYRIAHRELKLDTRSLIEDPLFQGSHLSQWVQMADLVAYTAYMRLARIPNKEFSWDWYGLLAATSATGPEPQDVNTLKRS